MDAYLDTNVVVRLAHADLKKISKPASKAIERYSLRISPIVLLELQYLYEIGRLQATSDAILAHLNTCVDLSVCPLPFAAVVQTANKESWTRDLFDRLIVAHARLAGDAPLLSADENIREHYTHAIW